MRRFGPTTTIAAMLMALATTGGAAAAGAAPVRPGWSVQPSPNPKHAWQSLLFGVACPTDTTCFAVGTSDRRIHGSEFQMTLAEHWDGSTWSIVPTPNPAHPDSELRGIACTSTTDCTAVGSSGEGGRPQVLVEHWDGSSWMIVPAPVPEGSTYSRLWGIACTSAGSCLAVGDHALGDRQVALIEHWDGTIWSIESPPDVPGSKEVFLLGVSCSGPAACTAVGSRSAGDGRWAYALRWDGASWLRQHVRRPLPAVDSLLYGVACTSIVSCTAVGSYFNHRSFERTMLEHWDGSDWSIQASPNPDGAVYAEMDAVACSSDDACMAVGQSSDAHTSVPLAERWDGARWHVEATVEPPGAQMSGFYGVSCSAAHACSAVYAETVDFKLIGTLVERYAG